MYEVELGKFLKRKQFHTEFEMLECFTGRGKLFLTKFWEISIIDAIRLSDAMIEE